MASLILPRRVTLLLFPFFVFFGVYFLTSINQASVPPALRSYPPNSHDAKEATFNYIEPLDPFPHHGQANLNNGKETVTEKVYVTVEKGDAAATTVFETQTATVVSTETAVSTVYAESDKSEYSKNASPYGGEDLSPKKNHLSAKDFRQKNTHYFHSERDSNRMVSNEVWREPADYPEYSFLTDKFRPQLPDFSYYENKAEYMRQPIVNDYANNAHKMFVMMKTGATVMWNRIPIHFLTTFTKLPYFALYSDMPASMGGYEVIDILANTTENTKKTGAYRHYTTLQKFFHEHANADPAEDVDGHDGWSLDRHKNIPMLAHGYRTAPKDVEWFFFMDGDTFMFMDNLMDYLNTLNASEPLYLGCSHWLYSERFAHGGSGVVLSRAALELSIGAHPEWEWDMEEETSRVCCGDYMVKKMMDRINVTVSHGSMNNIERKFNDEHFWSSYTAPENWCDKVLGFHHVRPYEVELLWEYERSLTPEARKHITYADIYRDFTAPYIKEYMPEWDSMAMEIQYCKKYDAEDAEKERKRNEEKKKKEEKEAKENKKEKGDDSEKEAAAAHEKREDKEPSGDSKPRPWWSVEHCKEACEKMHDCLSWRYLPNSNYCGLGKAVRLGRAAHLGKLHWDEREVDWDHEHATSGYMIDRIRKVRSEQKCDVIHGTTKDDDEKLLEDIKLGKVEDRYEGWGLRMNRSNDLDEAEKKLKKELAELRKKKAEKEKADNEKKQ